MSRMAGMVVKFILPIVAAIICLAAAYRFGSHGIALQDGFCIGLFFIASFIGISLLAFAAWNAKPKRRAAAKNIPS